MRLFNRAIHPELFRTRKAIEYEFPGGKFRAAITDAGHLLTLRRGDELVNEVVGVFPADLLPTMGVVVAAKANSGRDLHWAGGTLSYAGSCHVDVVDHEIFERIDREVTLDSRQADLYCKLSTGSRMDPAAASMVRVEPLDGAISVHALHTYPGEKSIVRTQSLFELS